jgi:hypothetical protein
MTMTPKPQRRRLPRRFRWLQTRHDGPCSKWATSTSIALPILAGRRRRHLNEAPLIPTNANDRRNQARAPHLKSPPAAVKSP